MASADLESLLAAGATAVGVPLDADQVARLVAYVVLVERWQHVTNLTGATDARRFAAEHVVDSLAVAPHLGDGHLVDVGSGAGLPGVVLAIACPRARLTLVEPRARRARFLTQARIELGLANVTVFNERVEALHLSVPCDAVVSRALGSLADFLAAVAHLVGPATRVVAMKGAIDDAELAAAERCGGAATVVPLAVPGFAARHLVTFRPGALRDPVPVVP